MKVMQQLNVPVENAPMQLARAAGAIADGGVSIEGVSCTERGDESLLHFVTDKTEPARKALEAAGYKPKLQNVFAFFLAEDRPGIIANIAKSLGEAGINIGNIYSASSGPKQPAVIYVWVAEADFEKAKEVCSKIK